MTSSWSRRAFMSPDKRYGMQPTNLMRAFACSFNSFKIFFIKYDNKKFYLTNMKEEENIINSLDVSRYKMDCHCSGMNLKPNFY